MKMLEKYLDYIRDNPEGYWFKRKLYGWGWTPVKWQGWVVVLGYIALVMLLAFTVDNSSSGKEVLLKSFVPIVLLTAALITICYKKGESPRWQWGERGDETH